VYIAVCIAVITTTAIAVSVRTEPININNARDVRSSGSADKRP